MFISIANIIKIVQFAAMTIIKIFAKKILNLSLRKNVNDKGNFKEILGI